MTREDAHHTLVAADHALGHELLRPGHARGARRLAPEAAGAHLRLGVENLLFRHLADHAITHLERPKALVEVHRAIDLDGAGDRVGPLLVAIEFVVVVAGWRKIGPAAFPPQTALVIELVEGVGAGGIDHGQPRHPVDEADLPQLGEGFAEGARVAKVAARHHDPVGHLPPQRLEHAKHDRLLPFEAEGIHTVHKVDAKLARHLLDAGHRVVEVAGDLDRKSAVVEGLRQLAVRNLSRADEDDAAHQPGDGAVDGERGARVARGGTGGPLRPDHPGMCEGGRHAVVFERARRVEALILQMQPAGLHAHEPTHAVRHGEQRLPLADRDHAFARGKRKQLVKPPHARIRERIAAAHPLALKDLERRGRPEPVPVVRHVEQVAARRTARKHLVHGKRGPAGRRNALLKRNVGAGGDGQLTVPQKTGGRSPACIQRRQFGPKNSIFEPPSARVGHRCGNSKERSMHENIAHRVLCGRRAASLTAHRPGLLYRAFLESAWGLLQPRVG